MFPVRTRTLAALLAVLCSTIAAGSVPARAQDLQTVAERSDYRATATGAEVMDLCRALAERSESVRLEELGRTTEDRAIPLMIVADPMVDSPVAAQKSGKLVALLVGNIHAGEVCGKEALPRLVRELTDAPGHPLLKNLVLLVVPNFNADGNEYVSKDNRPGQVGPEAGMGRRSNGQGLDLNRDFIKLESPEARALVAILNRWDPALVVDTHTTNGSLHRYALTYQGPQNPAGSPTMLRDFRERMIPAVVAEFQHETGKDAFYYGNFENDHTVWTGFPDSPRFFTNYVGLRNRIGLLTEAYAYATYKDRVLATLEFVRATLEYASAHVDKIHDLIREADAEAADAELSVIASKLTAFPEPVTVLGYEETVEDGHPVAGAVKDYEAVRVEQNYEPATLVKRPYAYLIPPNYPEAIAAVERHGLTTLKLTGPGSIDAGFYEIESIERADRPFEGHRLASLTVKETADTGHRDLEAGTVVVPAAGPLGGLAAYLLEPISADGLATWGLFDDGLAEGREFPVLRLESAPADPLPIAQADESQDPKPAANDAEVASKSEQKPITFETLLNGPRPNLGGRPANLRWLDGSHWLTNEAGRPTIVEARTGESVPLYDPAKLADAIQALPEFDESAAQRLARLGNRPQFTSDSKAVLFDVGEDLYYAKLDGSEARRLTSTPGAEELAEFSPDGTSVAYVRDNDLYVVDVETGTERALTTGGTDRVRHGKADWVYYEEIFNRDWKAFWWSPDSGHLAFLEIDDRHVGTHAVLNDLGAARVVEETPYPRAGEPNPHVRLGIVDANGGPVAWANLSEYSVDSSLISGVGWLGPNRAYCYTQNRTQTWLDVVTIDPESGATEVLFREETGAWVENPGSLVPLDDGGFLMPSERSGWKHIYKYQKDGQTVVPLTSGDWEVQSIDLLDEESGTVFFTAKKEGPLVASLYKVPLNGGDVERVTTEIGDHNASVSPDGSLVIDTWSTPENPPKVALLDADGERIRLVDEDPSPNLDDWRIATTEHIQISTPDGFLLEAEIVAPPDLDPSKKYPVWFMTYAGPHTPTLRGGWSPRLLDQALASEGFVAFRMDPRSASGKGAVSAHIAYKQLGVQELKDIETAIEWLKANRPYVDGDRIGMAGHSYGGYITAYAMTHSDLFAAGIAGAPVTDWRDYDSIYTERFMLTPQENPEGYASGSVVDAAANLHGRLLILHGAIDDNVSLRNTIRLVQALQFADKDFEMMLYPSSRHGIFGPHYNRIQLDFIKRTLGGPEPAAN